MAKEKDAATDPAVETKDPKVEVKQLTAEDIDKLVAERVAKQAEAQEAKQKEKEAELEALKSLLAETRNQQAEELKKLKEALQSKIDLPQPAAEPESADQILAKQLAALQAQLKEQAEAREKQHAELQAKLEAQQKAVEESEKKAEDLVKKSQLKAYKEKRLSELNLTLVDLVQGETVEELEASIQKAQELEAALVSKHTDQLATLQGPLKPGMLKTARTQTRTMKDMLNLVRDRGKFQEWKSDQLKKLEQQGIKLT